MGASPPPPPLGFTRTRSACMRAARPRQRLSRYSPPARKGGYVLEKIIGGTVAGVLSGPLGVAVDNNGFVYVADSFNHDVQKFDPSGKPVKFWGKFGWGELNSTRSWAWRSMPRET